MTNFKRCVALLLTFLLVLTVCSVYAFATDAAEKNDYLALGDSISTGYGLSAPETEGYTYLVAAEGGYSLDNRAVDGYTAEDIYLLIKDGALDEQIEGAELITLTCGGNDLMELLYQAIADAYNAENDPDIQKEEVLSAFAGTHGTLTMTAMMPYASAAMSGFSGTAEFRAGLNKYKADLTNVMQYLRAKNSDARIVLSTQYNPYKVFREHVIFGSLCTEVEAGVTALNAVIKANAESLCYEVAAVYNAFRMSPANLCVANADSMMMPNLDFHPNEQGHAVIAETVLSTIRSGADEETDSMEASTEEGSEPESTEAYESSETTESADLTSEIDEIVTPDCMEETVTAPESTSGTADAITDEPEDEETDGEEPSDGGCGSVIGLPAVLTVLFTVALAEVLMRRREKPLT